MFEVSEDYVINVTRGDAGAFTLKAKNEDGTPFVFEAGSLVRFKVFEKKDCNNVVLQKNVSVLANATEVQVVLTESETRNICKETISKPVDYWYEVELNPYNNPQTIVGYDDNGAKILRLYPEGRTLPEDEITEEDIPIVDNELDLASIRPIQNQVVAREFAKVNNKIQYITPEMYGALGNGVVDDTDAIHKMLNDDKNAHLPVLLSGKYACSRTITDTIGHTILPNSAEIVALDGFVGEFLFAVNLNSARLNQRKFSYCVNLDCRGKCKGFNLANSIGNKFDLVVKNATTNGFYLNRGTDTPIYENEIDVRVDYIGGAGTGAGVYVSGNDNMFGNVVVVNYPTAIENFGNSHYKYVHCWLDRNAASVYNNSVLLKDTANAPSATIDYFYADTYKTGVECPNYATVHIGTYYVLSGKEEMESGGVTATKHTVFKRGSGGTLSIDVLESYEKYDAFEIIDSVTALPYITIKEGHCSDFVQTAPMLQLIFPCSITETYTAYESVPSAIKTKITENGGTGNVQLSPIHMGGTRGFIARNSLVNNLFVSFYTGANYSIGEWKSLTLT